MDIIMAPLRGVTVATYRRVYKKHFSGISSAMAPFISTTACERVSDKLVKDILPQNNQNSYPIIPQIIGNKKEIVMPYLKKFVSMGFKEVNWNLGCPAPMITRKQKGSGALLYPELIEEYIAELSQFKKLDFSVKVRLGFEEIDDTIKLLPIFEKYGCKNITVHARTGQQGYSGRVNIDGFVQILNKSTIPVIYNGDILSKDIYNETKARFTKPISGIMLGRGILVNPFLPQEILGVARPNSAKEQVKMFITDLFHEYKQELSGIKPVLGRMKEIWRYLQFSFPHGNKFFKKITRSTEEEQYKKWVSKIFDTEFIPPKEYPNINF